MKRILTAALLALASFTASAQFAEYATGAITTQNLVPAGAATAGSAVELVTINKSGVIVQVVGTYTGVLSLQVTNDGANWVTLATATGVTNVAAGTTAATIASAAPGVYSLNIPGAMKTRVTGLAAMTGTATITIRSTAGSKIN